MSATREDTLDFVFFLIKAKRKHHPQPMWQEYETELRSKYGLVTHTDLWQIFYSLEATKHIYKGNDNEYNISPDFLDFSGFVESNKSNIQSQNKKDQRENNKQNITTAIAIIGTIGALSGWFAYFSDTKLTRANERIESLQKQNDSIRNEIELSKLNYERRLDSMVQHQKVIVAGDTAMNKHLR